MTLLDVAVWYASLGLMAAAGYRFGREVGRKEGEHPWLLRREKRKAALLVDRTEIEQALGRIANRHDREMLVRHLFEEEDDK